MDDTRDLVARICDAYAARDFPAMLAYFADDIGLHWRARPEHVEFSGSCASKADFAERLRELDEQFVYSAYVPALVLGEANRAASLIDVSLIGKADRANVDLQLGQFWTFRDGKAVELIEFYDTAFIASWMS